jgi:hypothetical protein
MEPQLFSPYMPSWHIHRQPCLLLSTLFGPEQIVENENTLYKSKQICAYAYDVVSDTKNIQTLKEILSELESVNRKSD